MHYVLGVDNKQLAQIMSLLAASTITWIMSQFHPFWAVVNKSNAV